MPINYPYKIRRGPNLGRVPTEILKNGSKYVMFSVSVRSQKQKKDRLTTANFVVVKQYSLFEWVVIDRDPLDTLNSMFALAVRVFRDSLNNSVRVYCNLFGNFSSH